MNEILVLEHVTNVKFCTLSYQEKLFVPLDQILRFLSLRPLTTVSLDNTKMHFWAFEVEIAKTG